MHEMSIAQSLLQIVQEEAQKHGVTDIVRIGVSIGAFSAVVPSALTFSFDLIKENTVAANAELVISEVPLMGRCTECGAESQMDAPGDDCPHCKAPGMQLIQGRELTIDYIETAEEGEG